jgi:hypothetical protein
VAKELAPDVRVTQHRAPALARTGKAYADQTELIARTPPQRRRRKTLPARCCSVARRVIHDHQILNVDGGRSLAI